jgi:TPR repeat protein
LSAGEAGVQHPGVMRSIFSKRWLLCPCLAANLAVAALTSGSGAGEDSPDSALFSGLAGGPIFLEKTEGLAASLSALEGRAAAGDPEAMLACARLHLVGWGERSADRAEGVRWLRRAAARGIPEAQHLLAVELLRHDWSEASLAEALAHLRPAVEVEPGARQFARLLFEEGPWEGLAPGPERARLLEVATAAGVAEAAYELALWRESVGGEAPDARALYVQAARGGSLLARHRLGFTTEAWNAASDEKIDFQLSRPMPPFERARAIARGYLEGDTAALEQAYREAAEVGHPEAHLHLARGALAQPDLSDSRRREAFDHLLRAAEGESVEAMRRVAQAFDRGEGGAAKDFPRALLWYLEAARRGDAAAASRLGEIYIAGDGLFYRDPVAAAAWWERAALQGHGPSKYNLAVLFDRGPAFLRDEAAARTLYQSAGMRGVAAARVRLATLLAQDPTLEDGRVHALALLYSTPGEARGALFESLEATLPESFRLRAKALAPTLVFEMPQK